MEFFFVGWITAAVYVAALVPKAAMATLVATLGITIVYPSIDLATFIIILWFPAVLLAAFRD